MLHWLQDKPGSVVGRARKDATEREATKSYAKQRDSCKQFARFILKARNG